MPLDVAEIERLQQENARLREERDRFEQLFAQAPALIASLQGPEHHFVFTNALYQQIVGNRPMVGKAVREAMPELVGQGYYELLDRCYQTGEPFFGHEMPAQIDRRGDGSLESGFFNFVYQPTRDAQGQVTGILIHAVEVTEMVLARRRVQESEDRYRSLVRASAQIVWNTDPEGLVDDIPEWRAYTGQSAEEIGGYGWLLAVHPDDRGEAERAWRGAVEVRGQYEVAYRIRRHDGEYRWFQARGVPVLEEDGTIREWVGTCTDIHDQRMSREALERTHAALTESEGRYRQLADAMPQLVWVTRPDGYHEYFNRRWYDFTGAKEGETDDWGWQNLLHPDDVERTTAVWTRCLETGEPYEIEYRFRNARGEYRWFIGRALPAFDGEGRITRWFGTLTDIHDQKLTEMRLQEANEMLAVQAEELQAQQEELQTQTEELQMQTEELQSQQAMIEAANRELIASEHRYRALADAMPQIVWTSGPDGKLDYYNERTMRFTGETLERLHGEGWQLVLHPDDLARTAEVWINAIETGEPYEVAFRIRRHDGEYRWHIGRALPVKDAEGRVVKWYGTSTDIHDQKRTEDALKEANDELVRLSAQAQAANKMKSEFLANMSHELRTPLNSIIGYTELVLMVAGDRLESVSRDNMDVVLRNARHLLNLINDVLDLSKIEAGKATVYPEPFDPRQALEAVMGTAEPLARAKGLSLSLEAVPGLGMVVSDETKLRQIVLNLVSNAIKFTKEGHVRLRLAPVDADRFQVVVEDTGIGIAPEHQRMIFEEFRQVDASSTRQAGGTGLGLSIARGLARLLGGDLTLESALGEGSVFTVTLPRHVHAAGSPQPREAVVPAAAAEGDKLVLAIDDDPEALRLLTEQLKGTGYAVVPAGSGELGLKLARELKPALVTLDICMPPPDGWEVLRVLKEDPETAGIPVVVLSFVDNRAQGFSLGAAAYLAKPIEREKLLATMASLAPAWEDGYVLVVEDDADARALYRQLLEPAGVKVVEAPDGQAATTLLEVLDRRMPSAVILDLMMPGMDGFEVLARMRANEQTRDVPVLVVTAKDLTTEDRTRLAAARRVLSKGDLGSGVLQDIRSFLADTAAIKEHA